MNGFTRQSLSPAQENRGVFLAPIWTLLNEVSWQRPQFGSQELKLIIFMLKHTPKRDASSKSCKANRRNSTVKCKTTTSPYHENKQVQAPEKRVLGSLYWLPSPPRSPRASQPGGTKAVARDQHDHPLGAWANTDSRVWSCQPQGWKTVYLSPSSLDDSNYPGVKPFPRCHPSEWDAVEFGDHCSGSQGLNSRSAQSQVPINSPFEMLTLIVPLKLYTGHVLYLADL